MERRCIVTIIALCGLLFAPGCGRSPEKKTSGPVATQGPREPAREAGVPAAGGVGAVASNAPATVPAAPSAAAPPATTAGETGAGGQGFAEVLPRIRAFMQEADVASAEKLCREAEGLFKDPANAAELAALMRDIRKAKKEIPKLRYAVEQLGSAEAMAVGAATGELRDAGDLGLIFLRQAVRKESSVIAGKAALALALSDDREAVPLLLERVMRDKDPSLGRAIGAALRGLKPYLTADQLALCHALVVGDGTLARHGLLSLLAAVFVEEGGRDPDRYNRTLSAADGYNTLRGCTERLLASGDAGLAAFAAPLAGTLDLTIPGLLAEKEINPNFAEAIALPVTAAMTNLVSAEESARTNAYAMLRAAGDLGRAVLYRAVREGKPAEARAAAIELVVRNDPRAHLAMADRLAREPADSPLSAVLTQSALQLASYIDAHTCRTLRGEGAAP